ncbi:type I polyketide synthase [Nannocystis pusilla]|uniref:type I polyketide synthase n=1 Tax=Nannocystis pusilla TaxID=889268 RepID=UPI003DA51E66
MNLGEGEGELLTGRISGREDTWLKDHGVHGVTLVPGTGLLELVHAAAEAVGGGAVAELTLVEPMVLPGEGGLRLQVKVGEEDEAGRRSVSVSSQDESAPAEAGWTRHASGSIHARSGEGRGVGEADGLGEQRGVAEGRGPGEGRGAWAELASWPAPGSEAVDIEGLHAALAGRGLVYGPAFRGLREVRRQGEVLYARVELAEGEAGGYALHPALLDAGLHCLAATTPAADPTVWLPFAWSEVTHHARGVRALRVRARREGQQIALLASDEEGRPVLEVGGLQLAQATAEQLRSQLRRDARDLYRLEFQPLVAAAGDEPRDATLVLGTGALATALRMKSVADVAALTRALDAGADAPGRLVIDATGPVHGPLEQIAMRATIEALQQAQALLREPRLQATELCWVTRGAVSASADDSPTGLAHAGLWGLVRSLRSERPERAIRLIDVDAPSNEHVRAALAGKHEPELVVRGDRIAAARLVRVPSPAAATVAWSGLDREAAVVVTGGVGGLGASVAEHLVGAHGVRHLVLVSRRGLRSDGAAALRDRLLAAGASEVRIAECDVADRDAVARLLEQVRGARPLGAVFHLAGQLDDGLLADQTPERFARVLAPKLLGALHLAALTERDRLAAFVLFSSVAGTLGSPGQSSYAAANAWLDAFAAHRRGRSLPALSVAWGPWSHEGGGMTARIGAADRARIRRQGVDALAPAEALRLLDASSDRELVQVVPIKLRLAALQRRADEGDAPAWSRALVRARLRDGSGATPAGAESLQARLARVAKAERPRVVVDLVRAEIAAVLGLSTEVAADQTLRNLGFDSLMAVDLRNRLSARCGVTLPATLAFDHPTPAAIAELLLSRIAVDAAEAAPPRGTARVADEQIDALVRLLRRATPTQIEDAGLGRELTGLLEKLAAHVSVPEAPEVAHTGDTQDLLRFLDQKLGVGE